jgi:hypothetical protein
MGIGTCGVSSCILGISKMPSSRHSDELKLEQIKQASEDRRVATLEYSRLTHDLFLRDHHASKEYAIMCLRSLFHGLNY